MESYSTQSAVLMIVFNRADKAQKVISAIKKVKPPRLYIAADGPRSGRNDLVACQQTRDVVQEIDWPCEVKTLFQDKNLGCGLAPATAISWFFEQEESGIILEDDCVATIDFFRFCDELLERYKDDERVMQISGSNFHKGWKRDQDYSYYYSTIGLCWGWASWRRAWKHYDFYVKMVPELKSKGYLEDYLMKDTIDYFAFHPNIEKEHWDFQWDFAKFINSGLSIIPQINMIQNIGLDADSTHDFDANKYNFNTGQRMGFPLSHPPFMIKDTVSDQRYYDKFWAHSLGYKIKMKIKEYVPPKVWNAGKKILKTSN